MLQVPKWMGDAGWCHLLKSPNTRMHPLHDPNDPLVVAGLLMAVLFFSLI